MRSVANRIDRARVRIGRMYGPLSTGAHGALFLAGIRAFLAGEALDVIERNLRRGGMDEPTIRWCIDMAFGALEEEPAR